MSFLSQILCETAVNGAWKDLKMPFWRYQKGLKAWIGALGLELGPLGWDWSLGGGMEKEEEEKISHMCESIGHRPLWAAAQKGGQKKNMI